VDAAYLANAAYVDPSGLLSVLGAHIEIVNAPQFPWRSQLWVIVRLLVEEPDDGDVPIAVIVEHDDTERLLRMDGTARVLAHPPTADPDLPVSVQIVLPLQLEFRRDGLYHVKVLFNGEEIVDKRLKVRSILPTV
jgi:hypothetical protein